MLMMITILFSRKVSFNLKFEEFELNLSDWDSIYDRRRSNINKIEQNLKFEIRQAKFSDGLPVVSSGVRNFYASCSPSVSGWQIQGNDRASSRSNTEEH